MSKAASNKASIESAKERPALMVRPVAGVKSFCRAGHKFTETPVGIDLQLLSDEQIAALKAEKMLVVEECTYPLESSADVGTGAGE